MKAWFFIILAVLVIPDLSYAASEQATFKSFYLESSYIGWTLAAVITLLSVVAIIFTGGAASPVVASIGTWIGGLMGLSGAAATNAGLALLGGGSIASGGLGVAGGTLLLTAALSFSTDVLFDYTIGEAVARYNYSEMAEQSKHLQTLPLPINESGSDLYEDGVKILSGIEEDRLLSSNPNQKIIRKAILKMESEAGITDIGERTKNESLLALLYFISNDYKDAKKHAENAIEFARSLDIRRTLPAFVYATSALYEEHYDINTITNDYFRYAVLAEPDNPLIPRLFKIFIDRMMLSVNDEYTKDEGFVAVFEIMKSSSLEDFRAQNYVFLLARYLILLHSEQRTIITITEASNPTIKNSSEAHDAVQNSLRSYQDLLKSGRNVVQETLSLKRSLNEEGKAHLDELSNAFEVYYTRGFGLENIVNDYMNDKKSVNDAYSNWSIYLMITIVIIVFTAFLVRKRSYRLFVGRNE